MEIQEAIIQTINQLSNAALDNSEKSDIVNAVGEVEIEGTSYQIQIQFVANKKLWVKENQIRYQQTPKIYDLP